MLTRFGFSLDKLPSLPIDLSRTSEDSLTMIQDVIYRAFIHATWVFSLSRTPKLDHYAQHYLQVKDDMISPPGYINLHLPLKLRMSLR